MWPSGVTHVHLKRWPENYWASLAEACIERGGASCSPAVSQDVDLTRRWIAQLEGENRIENRAGVSIRETISILQNAEAVVSVNTGVMHLAAALGVPTIDLHGPTNAKRWGPIGLGRLRCKFRHHTGHISIWVSNIPSDAETRQGMETISVQDVLQALSKIVPDFPATERRRANELVEA